tara:strand:+ start:106 stop:366 length:261 start_codon:yes stop_codon:yes gene_type:complete
MKKKFTLKIYNEKNMKMLNTISSIFTRRNINIKSMVTSEIIEEDIISYTIVIYEDENIVKRLLNKLEKQVKIIKVDIEENKEIEVY